jgi:hypothetical protein
MPGITDESVSKVLKVSRYSVFAVRSSRGITLKLKVLVESVTIAWHPK